MAHQWLMLVCLPVRVKPFRCAIGKDVRAFQTASTLSLSIYFRMDTISRNELPGHPIIISGHFIMSG